MMVEKYRFSSKIIKFLAWIIDFFGYSFFGLLSMFGMYKYNGQIKTKNAGKMLVVRLDDVGDVVLATPFIRALKENFPESKIDMLVKNSTKKILANDPHLRRVISFEPFWMRTKKAFGFAKTLKFINSLRKEKYDIIFDLRGNPFNILLMFFIGGKYRVSYNSQGMGFLLTHCVKETELKHSAERNFNILRSISLKVKSKQPKVYLSERDRKFADLFLIKNGIKNGDFIVGVHAGASWRPRIWPKERFAEAIGRLVQKYNAKIILFGSKDEQELVKSIICLAGKESYDSIANACGKTNLTQLAALLSKCSLFIGNDSGPMHIASSLRIPMIALFGSQSPEIFGPYQNKNAISIYKQEECSPCIQKLNCGCAKGFDVCRGMLKIKVTDLLNAVRRKAGR
jgi:lipopolysaccharide heptosyltransferase II